jgi:hypothetical protein
VLFPDRRYRHAKEEHRGWPDYGAGLCAWDAEWHPWVGDRGITT